MQKPFPADLGRVFLCHPGVKHSTLQLKPAQFPHFFLQGKAAKRPPDVDRDFLSGLAAPGMFLHADREHCLKVMTGICLEGEQRF
jgi:hypothetical protein